jgi:hypothetical protein
MPSAQMISGYLRGAFGLQFILGKIPHASCPGHLPHGLQPANVGRERHVLQFRFYKKLSWVSIAPRVNLMTLKLALEVKAVYSLRAALYIVKLLMLLHKLSTAAA